MTWPTTPPPMPAPGWYPDPEQHSTWRWWDGVRWTEVRHAMPQPAPRDPYSFSAWFEASTAAVKVAVRRVGLVVALSFAACFALIWLLIHRAVVSAEGRELRDILRLDELFTADRSTIELTRAEGDRVVDLFGDLARTWGPWLVLLVIVTGLVMTWATALVARAVALDRAVADPAGTGATQEPSLRSLSIAAVRRTPAVLGSMLVLGGIMIAATLVAMVPMLLFLLADASGVLVGVTGAFGAIAAIVLVVWLVGRLLLAVTVAALGGHGIGVRRSWDLTRGHYWGVVGRYVVASLIASVATAPLNLIVNLGIGLSVGLYIVILAILQAVSSAASALVLTPAMVVLIDHLEEQHSAVE